MGTARAFLQGLKQEVGWKRADCKDWTEQYEEGVKLKIIKAEPRVDERLESSSP